MWPARQSSGNMASVNTDTNAYFATLHIGAHLLQVLTFWGERVGASRIAVLHNAIAAWFQPFAVAVYTQRAIEFIKLNVHLLRSSWLRGLNFALLSARTTDLTNPSIITL